MSTIYQQNIMKINTLYNKDLNYPKKLNDLFKVPDKIYYRGDINLKPISIGIVGTRKATEYGKNIVKYIVQNLKSYNLSIISGLAFGIDSYAHLYSTKFNLHSVAVLPGNIHEIYPKTNSNLAKRILKNGALVSEYPDNEMHKSNFLERNRIIAALSDVLIVVEAGRRSGSINTASHALELNREVMAVPGNIFNHYSIGTNNLIKMGAHPFTQIKDLLQLINVEPQDDELHFKSIEHRDLYMSIKEHGGLTVDQIIKLTNLSHGKVIILLTELELEGKLHTQQGKYLPM